MSILALSLISTTSAAVTSETLSRPYGERPQFEQIDINKDGNVDASEFDQYHQQRISDRVAQKRLMQNRIQESMFNAIDQNVDGVINSEEFRLHQEQRRQYQGQGHQYQGQGHQYQGQGHQYQGQGHQYQGQGRHHQGQRCLMW